MIIFDTETTGLLEASLASIEKQPRIIEFAAVKGEFIDDRFFIDRQLHFLVNPGIPVDKKWLKTLGIGEHDLEGEPRLVKFLGELQNFFLGQRQMVAHNLPFDRGVLAEELKRIDRLLNFPWPIQHLCTVELTQDLHLKDRKLTTLYEHYMKEPLKQTHRAMDDVMALVKIVEKMHFEDRL